jgi:hypothetical protein
MVRRYGALEREESDGGLAAVFGTNKDKDKDKDSGKDYLHAQQQPTPIDNSKCYHSNTACNITSVM